MKLEPGLNYFQKKARTKQFTPCVIYIPFYEKIAQIKTFTLMWWIFSYDKCVALDSPFFSITINLTCFIAELSSRVVWGDERIKSTNAWDSLNIYGIWIVLLKVKRALGKFVWRFWSLDLFEYDVTFHRARGLKAEIVMKALEMFLFNSFAIYALGDRLAPSSSSRFVT